MTRNDYNYKFKLTESSAFDRERNRKVALYGRVSTEHEAQLSALENQMQWYDDQIKYHPNWDIFDRYIDEGITGTQAKKRPSFLRMLEDAKRGKFDLIVTREVCRFARNVVDTLVITRELKGIGVEVFFIEDNIWTMDGDGELRLSLMATLAQEESRKVSERVRAGQQISRNNGVLYGNGNILGYDRVEDTYVINEEQAETVRMIYDMYLRGEGSLRISNYLTQQRRKTAMGLIKWSPANVVRVIKNATYTGTKCYNKSRSNNFLEQHRILNLDMSTYEYVPGDFPPIISQEVWEKAQRMLGSKKKQVSVRGGKITESHRNSRDLWVNKLRCSCGSTCRKDVWYRRHDGNNTYGYQCYNRINNGTKQKREELGLDTDGYCGIRMYGEWKLQFMAQELMKHLLFDREESVQTALSLIKQFAKGNQTNNISQAASIQSRIDKIKARMQRYIVMRADGEMSKDEYNKVRRQSEADIKKLTAELAKADDTVEVAEELDIKAIESALRKLVDTADERSYLDLIDEIVYKVTPVTETHFEWYLHLSGDVDAKANFSIDGRKQKAVVKLEEIEEISSVHIEKVIVITRILSDSRLSEYLHRQLSRMAGTEISIVIEQTL